MTTKITIDPQLVREVLCNHINKTIFLYESFGATIWDEKENSPAKLHLNIHEFVYKAIEWCAGKGYPTSRINHCKGAGIVYATIDGIKLGYTWGSEGADYPTYIEAELEMLNDVWEQIQKEKKEC